MPTWIGLEAAMLPDENEKDCLRTLQKSITEYRQEEQNAFRESKWGKQAPITDEAQAVLDGIKSSNDLTELKSWWLKSKGNLSLSTEWKAKEKQLLKDAK